MSAADLAKLVFLSAIWGGSFLFLNESIGLSTVVGAAVVLVAMSLVLTAPKA